MSVQIDVPLPFRYISDGLAVANVNGSTVGECLDSFAEQFPGVKGLLFDKDGILLRYIDVYVNGKSTYPEQLTKKVNNGDKISFFYLIVGG